jgi:DNA-binding transcriptional ArsR family regulator
MEALSNPVRVAILHRLARPTFVPDLARELGMTRQALRKHLKVLEDAGLVRAQSSQRRLLRASEYRVDPVGLFSFKEAVRALAVHGPPDPLPLPTRAAGSAGAPPRMAGGGLLLVHGDAPGRWMLLPASGSAIVGRDPKADVRLAYDAFASARHALLQAGPEGVLVTDLHSTNGTLLNFRPLLPGEPAPLRHGDLLTVGRSHLLYRDGE